MNAEVGMNAASATDRLAPVHLDPQVQIENAPSCLHHIFILGIILGMGMGTGTGTERSSTNAIPHHQPAVG
jgi:hypothetical protein